VYEVPMDRLLWSLVRSEATVAMVVFVAALAVAVVWSGQWQIAFGAFPAVFGVVSLVWTRLNTGALFRAATSPDGIRLRHGLTEARAQTVPPGRVQAVKISQGPLWRGKDWWQVSMNVAGYGGEAQSSSGVPHHAATVLHPVATRAEAATALWLVLPDLGVADPVAAIDSALTGTLDDGGFLAAPRRARWLDPVSWRRHGVLVTRRALVLRSGRWWRSVVIVPHERTQSLGLAQGPLQRRLRLATFHLHSTPGPVTPRVAHLGAHTAADLLAQQAIRAREARVTAGPEQWMRPPLAPTPTPTPTAAQAADQAVAPAAPPPRGEGAS
jgi:putative membrane protein